MNNSYSISPLDSKTNIRCISQEVRSECESILNSLKSSHNSPWERCRIRHCADDILMSPEEFFDKAIHSIVSDKPIVHLIRDAIKYATITQGIHCGLSTNGYECSVVPTCNVYHHHLIKWFLTNFKDLPNDFMQDDSKRSRKWLYEGASCNPFGWVFYQCYHCDMDWLARSLFQDNYRQYKVIVESRIPAISIRSSAEAITELSARFDTLISEGKAKDVADKSISIEALSQDVNKMHKELYGSNNLPTDAPSIRHKVNGNGLRIGGYMGIVKMVENASTIIDKLEASDSLNWHEHIDQTNSKLQSLTTEFNTFKEEKNKELQQLRDTIEELKQATMPTHEYVKRIETIPIYDYELIKARRRLMHQEYRTSFKFFNRLVQLRYEICYEIMPMAVPVSK